MSVHKNKQTVFSYSAIAHHPPLLSLREEPRQNSISRMRSERLLYSYRNCDSSPGSNYYGVKLASSIRPEEERKGSLSRRRPASLNFKNDLFKQLANKMQKSKEPKAEIRQQILSDYYHDERDDANKENAVVKSNAGIVSKKIETPGKKELKKTMSNKLRYGLKVQEVEEKEKEKQKQKEVEKGIKFNKLRSKPPAKVPNQEYDLVRTSEGEFHSKVGSSRESLDMNPVL